MSDTDRTGGPKRVSSERGRFSDGTRVFNVHASGQSAPDSFQVSVDCEQVDIVLVVSGLNTGQLHATWGEGWRTASEDWRRWFEDQAFMAFYNGQRPPKGKVRFCNG
ncbi:hypothetical protein [Glycomyces buryatensis]|uniref:Uncharacterized protein n=1 Tax=Glycomyces buryatensis TaxID=2570927 RepID=A0A4V4HT21_9ACTN|nr:hypothetical protein [Glycomyces buryatensis]THV43316.1 hypothetical protein FAB82_01155 [Glycomyces buryatensis]